MKWNPKLILVLLAIALAIYLLGLYTGCSAGKSAEPTTLPGIPTSNDPIAEVKIDTVIKPGATIVLDTGSYRVDTAYIKAPFWIFDTVYVEKPSTLPHFNIPSVAASIAPAIIAAFKPPTPRNLFELWLHAGHDFLNSGYSGGLEADINLDQIRLANMTIYGDLGYDHAFHVSAGIRGKLWGDL